ncbi:hypothetical protein Tco_0144071 [Tanacetum coccineum]
MARTNVRRGGRGGRVGGRGLSDHATTRGWGQKSIRTNNFGTRSKTNATMSFDTGVQEHVGENEPNTDVIDIKVSHKITSILKTMFNGSWTTWKEVDKSTRDEYERILSNSGVFCEDELKGALFGGKTKIFEDC